MESNSNILAVYIIKKNRSILKYWASSIMKTTKGCNAKPKRDPKSGKSQIPVRSGSTFRWRIQQCGSKDDGDGGSDRKPAMKRHQLQVTRTQGRRRDNLSASRPVGSEISFVTFAETTKPYTIENAVQCSFASPEI